MPNYDYRCRTHTDIWTEVARSFEERDDFPLCETCKEPMERVYSAPAIKFNGTGFYSTGG